MAIDATRKPKPPVLGDWHKIIEGLGIFYIPNDLAWTSKAPVHTGRVWSYAFGINGKVWVVGGAYGSGGKAAVEVYDPATNAWTVKSNPFSRSGQAFVATPQGKIYALGGLGSAQIMPKTVEEYDPVTNTVTARADMLVGCYAPGVAVTPEGKIVVMGGYVKPDVTIATVQEYDTLTDTWHSKKSMPTARYHLTAATAADGRIYAIGGFVWGGADELAVVEAYDPSSDAWTAKAAMPTARRCHAAVRASNNRIYALGGLHSCASLAIVEEYDPAKNSWAAKAPLPTARWGLAAAALGNKLYAIGGYLRTGDFQEGNPNVQALAVTEEGTLPAP